ncbi:MAG: zinc ribbon domain-containing protein [Gemmatimonadales bacterium]|nr:zinc ribbon domain-containing protein [Gemmatimonadales bacterium]
MSSLSRLFRHLVNTLAEQDPALLHAPIPVRDVLHVHLPYRVARRALGVDASEDWEALMLQLLAGEEGLATTEPAPLFARLQEQARSPNPDLRVLLDAEQGTLRFDTEAMAYALGPGEEGGQEGPRAGGQGLRADAPDGDDAAGIELVAGREPHVADDDEGPWADDEPGLAPEPPATRDPRPVTGRDPLPAPPPYSFDIDPATATPPPSIATRPGRCPYCGGKLPGSRAVNFCPHCGESMTTTRCPECQAEVELGWKFCVGCGTSLPEL